MRAIISALVISDLSSFINSCLLSQLRAKNLTDPRNQIPMKGVHLSIRQRPVFCPIRNRIGQTLFALWNRSALVLVKYMHVFNERMVELLFDPTNNPLSRKAILQYYRQIPLNGRKSWQGTNPSMSSSKISAEGRPSSSQRSGCSSPT